MTIIGVDIGQAQDFTAIAILQPHKCIDNHREYHCSWIERLPLGTPYREILTRVDHHKTKVGKASIIFDATGVGRPIVEQARRVIRNAHIVGLTITGGRSAHGWNVPKRDLITNLQILLQSERLKIAKQLPHISLVLAELQVYQVQINNNAHEEYGPWRESEHDDLVLALAIASYAATRMMPMTGNT